MFDLDIRGKFSGSNEVQGSRRELSAKAYEMLNAWADALPSASAQGIDAVEFGRETVELKTLNFSIICRFIFQARVSLPWGPRAGTGLKWSIARPIVRILDVKQH